MRRSIDFEIVFLNVMMWLLGGLLVFAFIAVFVQCGRECDNEKRYETVSTDNGVEVQKMTTADSTTLYRVWDNGHYVYFTDHGHTEYTYRTGGGKMPRRTHRVTCD